MFKYILILCLVYVIHNGSAKECADCVDFTSCPNAVELSKIRNAETAAKFKSAFCGFENVGNKRTPKVCCSEFTGLSSRVSDDVDIESHPNARLLPDDCGDIDGKRIIGGTAATLYEYPWMTLISYRTREGLQFLCGGSVINSRYILTAAHCVENKIIAGVRIGEYDIRYKTDCQGEHEDFHCESHLQDMLVEETVIHENYVGLPSVINDIALLRLKKTINFTYRNAGPICLPLSNAVRSVTLGGKVGTVAGWGVTEHNKESSILLKVDVPILTSEQCRSVYNRRTSPGERDRTENELCAGKLNKDSCNGDSGGPLMLEDLYKGRHRIIQYGIVSRGPKQCGSDNPGIYTDVTKFMGWILNNIKE